MNIHTKNAGNNKEHGFTLIELLVVISIIALLLAILMPSLSAAKERARTVVCGAHIRQLGMATQIYIHDTEYLPIFGQYKNRPYPNCYAHNDPWTGPTVGETPVDDWNDINCFGTPMSALIKTGCLDDASAFLGACPTSSKKVLLSYGYNYANLGGASTPYGVRKNGDEWIKSTRVERPSETGMYCDGTTSGGINGEYPRKGSWGIPYWEPKFWPDFERPTSSYWSDPSGFTQQQIIGHQKGTKIMVAYVDGHASVVPVEECHGDYSYDYKVRVWLRNKRWGP